MRVILDIVVFLGLFLALAYALAVVHKTKPQKQTKVGLDVNPSDLEQDPKRVVKLMQWRNNGRIQKRKDSVLGREV